MERHIAGLVRDFELGKINRRQFCEGVALAATVFAAGSAAQAAPSQGLKMLGVNHVSYACSDYRVARDWYTKVLNLKAYNDKGMGRANLAFGPEQGKGGQFVITRNFGNNERKSQAMVDHICYTVADWDDKRVVDGLTAAGAKPATARHGSVNVYDPNNYQVQIASIEGENPWI